MSDALILTAAEKRVAWLMAAVQFMNIMDFMMLMPLGPDFAPALRIAPSDLGYVGAAYSAAAAVAGLAGIAIFDRFDRKSVLLVALTGLALAGAAASMASDMTTLIAARIVAGLCGGPASAMAASIVADAVANERRGQAMGIYMGAFSMAAVLGVPAGLELAHLDGWRLPLLATGLCVSAAAILVWKMLPAQDAHLKHPGRGARGQFLNLLADRRAVLALALCSATMLSHFMLVPNFSPFFQINLGFPREQLGLLYMIGGVLSFFGMRFAGWLVDRFGAASVTMATSLGVIVTIYAAMIDLSRLIPVLVAMPLFMLFASGRTVAQTTTVSKVPPPAQRASFMSLVSCVSGASMALGAFLSSTIMTTGPDGRLQNVTAATLLSIALACLAPPLMLALERAVRSARQPHPAAITPAGVRPS